MKKLVLAGLVAVVATLALVPPGEARDRGHRHGFHGHRHHHHGFHRGHSRVIVGFGPTFYWGPRPYWYYYPAPSAVYAPPPVVIQQTPPVYIQQQTPPPPSTAAPEQYWHYCESARGYYPAVPSCPEPWVLVPPRP